MAILFAGIAPALAQAPTSGLKGHWTFDEPAGSTSAADSSGNSNNAYCGWDCPTFGTPGKVGTAATFDGGDDFVNVYNTIPNSFTIAAWIKTTAWGEGWGPAYSGHGIIWADVGGGGPDMIPMALVGNQLAFGTGENCPNYTYDTLTSTVPVNTGEWVHVAVTRNTSTGEKQLYLNGVLDGSDFNGGNCPLDYNYGGQIAFGANWLDGRYFDGQLDDVYFYDRVLSAAEVQSLMALPQLNTVTLSNTVSSLVASSILSSGNGNALSSKLSAALQQLNSGNKGAAVNQLGAFINQLNGLVNSRRLTAAQAQPLIDAANAIIASVQ